MKITNYVLRLSHLLDAKNDSRNVLEPIAGALIAAVAIALALVFAARLVTEPAAHNSYALVAHSLLTLTPDVPRCFDGDCAIRGGKLYVVFPPFPGVLVAPLVAIFGVETRGFFAIGLLCLASSLFIWQRILRKLEVPGTYHLPFLAAIAFASPVFSVTMKTPSIWFFAQAVAFPLVSLAILGALSGHLVIAGMAVAAAFLCRQMSILYAPILLFMMLSPSEPLLTIKRQRLGLTVRLAIPVCVGILLYFAYNYWRFGNPLDTGYADINFPGGMMHERVSAHGLWSVAYVPYNFLYLLIQGFHADFIEPQRIHLLGMDTGGTSILAASPWLLYLIFAPWRRDTLACLALVLGLSAAMLFYHSNGFVQFNTQRYTMDWLPAALFILAVALRQVKGELFRPLVLWGMVLNLAAVAVMALTMGNKALACSAGM